MPKGVYDHKHLVKKTYPAEMVAAVKEHYEAGMSQDELAEMLGVTQRVIWRLMLNHEIPRRKAIKRNQRGSNNDSWKGDDVTYSALHYRVYSLRGLPKFCEMCKTDEKSVRYEWANMTGKYNDPNDYQRLCVFCHRKLDKKRRDETGKRTSPVSRKRGDA